MLNQTHCPHCGKCPTCGQVAPPLQGVTWGSYYPYQYSYTVAGSAVGPATGQAQAGNTDASGGDGGTVI